MGNIVNVHNYGDNYTMQYGSFVVAGGAKMALLRERILAGQEQADRRKQAAGQDVDLEEAEWQDVDSQKDVNLRDIVDQQDATGEPQLGKSEIMMRKVSGAIAQMQKEKCPLEKHCFFGQGLGYQYAYVFALMNCKDTIKLFHLPYFDTAKEFLSYLREIGVKGVCSDQTINNRMKLLGGKYPDWEIVCGSENDNLIAVSVAKRFISLYKQS